MAKLYVLTRHGGLVDWLQAKGYIDDAQVVAHADDAFLESLQTGDVVIGVAPPHLIAAINQQGARFIAVEMRIPHELRGRELSAEDMDKCGAQLREVSVRMSHILTPDALRAIAGVA